MKRGVSISVYKGPLVLVVTNRRNGGFSLPGGKVDPGEDVDVAAWRELKEETGLVPDALKYLGCSLFSNEKKPDEPPFLVSHFEAVMKNPGPEKVEEGTTPFWIAPIEVFENEESVFRNHYKQISLLGVVRPYAF